MKAVHIPGLVDLCWADNPAVPEHMRQGQFDVQTEPGGQKRLWFVCPGKCKSLAAIAIRPVVDGSPQAWDWNGSTDSPTLSPSINHNGCWHGWLAGGVFTGC